MTASVAYGNSSEKIILYSGRSLLLCLSDTGSTPVISKSCNTQALNCSDNRKVGDKSMVQKDCVTLLTSKGFLNKRFSNNLFWSVSHLFQYNRGFSITLKAVSITLSKISSLDVSFCSFISIVFVLIAISSIFCSIFFLVILLSVSAITSIIFHSFSNNLFLSSISFLIVCLSSLPLSFASLFNSSTWKFINFLSAWMDWSNSVNCGCRTLGITHHFQSHSHFLLNV